MKVIGLTGGIGSGKTTVARIFETLGIPVFYADQVGREVLEEPTIRMKVTELLGSEAYSGDRSNRARIAETVFGDTKKLQALNAIVHPVVSERFNAWCAIQSSPYVLREAAILFESGKHRDCDAIISVSAPQELRLERAAARDNVPKSEILQRMSRQWPQEEKDRQSNFVIKNDGSQALIPQVMNIHAELAVSVPQS